MVVIQHYEFEDAKLDRIVLYSACVKLNILHICVFIHQCESIVTYPEWYSLYSQYVTLVWIGTRM